MLNQGDIVLFLDDSPGAERSRSFATCLFAVAKELGLLPKYYLAPGGLIPRQTEAEFLEDLASCRALVAYLAPVKSEIIRASQAPLNINNLGGKHVLLYSNSESTDTAWLGVNLLI